MPSPPIPRPRSTEAWLAVGDSFADAMALRPGAPDFILPVDSWTGLGQGLAIAPHVRAYNDQPTPHDANKLIAFSLFMSGDERGGMDTVLQNWREIEHRLDMAAQAAAPHPRGTGVVFIQRLGDANDYVYFDVRTGVLTSVDVNLPGTANWGAVVQLQCSQFGRQGRAITIDAATADTLTNGPGCFAFWQNVPGDAPALCEIRIRDVSPAGHGPIARLHLARRSYRRMAVGDFVPIDATSGVVTTSADWQQAAVAYFDAPGPHQGPLEDLWAMVQDDSPVLAFPTGGPAVTRLPGGAVLAVPIKYQVSAVDALGNEGTLSPATVIAGGQGADILVAAPVEAPTLGDEGWGVTLGSNAAGFTSAAAQNNTANDTGTYGILTETACPIGKSNQTYIVAPTHAPGVSNFYQWRARLDNLTPGESGGSGTVGLRLFGDLLWYINSASPHWSLLGGPMIPVPFDGNWHTWAVAVRPSGIDLYLDRALLGSTPNSWELADLGATVQHLDILVAAPVEAPTLGDEGWGVTLGSNAAGFTSAAAQNNTANDTGTYGILTETACPGSGSNRTYLFTPPAHSVLSPSLPTFYQWRARHDAFTPGAYGGTGSIVLEMFGGLIGYVNAATPYWFVGGHTAPSDAITAIPFDGNWHTWQLQVTPSSGFTPAAAVLSLDGSRLSDVAPGFPGDLGARVFDNGGSGGFVTYAVDNFVVSTYPLSVTDMTIGRSIRYAVDNFAFSTDLLTVSDMATALNKDSISWTSLAGAASYNIYATMAGLTYRFVGISGTSITITEIQDGALFAFPTTAGLPPIAPAQLRVGVGLGHQTADLYHSRPVRTPQQNETPTMMRIATIPVPPTSRPDSEDGTSTPPFTIVVEARTGGQNASPLHIAGLWHMPAEAPEPDLIQITATAPGLAAAREWRIGTNRWGRSYCHLHDLDTGALVASADVTGALNLGWGDSVLVILPEADDGAGGFKADLALAVKAGVVIIPRWRLGVAGEGGPP